MEERRCHCLLRDWLAGIKLHGGFWRHPLEAPTQNIRAYGRHGAISYKLPQNEFMDLCIGGFHRKASKPPNAHQNTGEHAGFPRFFNLEAYYGGSHERLHMHPTPIARGDIEHS